MAPSHPSGTSGESCVTIPEPYPPDGKLGASDQIVITPHVGARREDAWQAIEASTLSIFDEEDRP